MFPCHELLGPWLENCYFPFTIIFDKVFVFCFQLSVSYRPFLYGEATEFVATIQKGSNVTYVWDFGDSSTLTTDSNTVKHLFQGYVSIISVVYYTA